MNKIFTVTYDRPQIVQLAQCLVNSTIKPDVWVIVHNTGPDPMQYLQGFTKDLNIKILNQTRTDRDMRALGYSLLLSQFNDADKIILFDDDDYMPPTYIKERLQDLNNYDLTFCNVRRYLKIQSWTCWQHSIGGGRGAVTSNMAFTNCRKNFQAAVSYALDTNRCNIDTFLSLRFCPKNYSKYTYNTIPIGVLDWGIGDNPIRPYQNYYKSNNSLISSWLGADQFRYKKYKRSF